MLTVPRGLQWRSGWPAVSTGLTSPPSGYLHDVPFWTKAKSNRATELADRVRKLASLDQRSGIVFHQVEDDSKAVAAELLDLDDQTFAEVLRDLLNRPGRLFRAYHLPSAVFGSARARASLQTAGDIEGIAGILLQAYGRPGLRTDSAPYTFLMAPLKSLLVSGVEAADTKDPGVDSAMHVLVDLLAEEHPHLGDISGRCAARVRRLSAPRFKSLLGRWVGAQRCLGKQLAALRNGVGADESAFQTTMLVLLDAPHSDPTADWLGRWSVARTSHDPGGLRETVAEVVEIGVSEPGMAEGEPVSLTRGAIWGLADWTDSRTRDQLESIPLAEVPREVPSNAALWSLAQPHDDESIRRLLRVISKVRHRGLRTRAERLLSHAAEARHETPGSLADRLVPTHGLDSNGARSWVVDGYRVEVRLMPDGEVQRVIRRPDGKPVVSAQKALQNQGIDIWREIAATIKRLKSELTEQKHRLEDAMVEGRFWSVRDWQSTVGANPVMASLARRLVWKVAYPGHDLFVMPAGDDRWELHEGGHVEIPEEAAISLAHPLAMPAEQLDGWRHRIVATGIVQPLRQLFREVYVVTPVERQAGDHSARFAGHSVPLAQVYALTKTRGWKGKLGLAGFEGAGEGWKEFPARQVRVCLRHAGDDPQLALGVIEDVYFERKEGGRSKSKTWRRMQLADVDPIAFSEAMRDVDLIVSAASIGRQFSAQEWEALRNSDRESWLAAQPRAEYLTQASAQTRGQLLLELAPLLGIQDHVRLDGHFAVVDGKLGRYRIHLGTSSIYMEPGRHAICIIPAKSEARRILLPFEERDYMTSLVFSKVLLMLDDDRITDPTILRQMGRTA